jgi:radial spoke head protein 3
MGVQETPDSPAIETKQKKAAPRNPHPTASSPQRQQQQQRPPTPPPVDGRSHMDIQTDNYLEELTDRNPEMDVDTQTDALLDLHHPVSFIPLPSGIDAWTQIEHGDLFDFDLEVEPILEVLVGKTLEIGMLEVLEEEELSEIRHRQEMFEQARNAELAEVQRLEAEAKRKYAEKQRRLDDEQRRLAAQAELEEKVAARGFAKHYLSDLHTKVFDSLIETGHFYDPLLKDIREVFLPDVVQQASEVAHATEIARKLVESILVDTLKRRSAMGISPPML